ncbi:MAG: hypothetical protein ABIT96_07800 [Ferruginibacter sp.]
MKYVVPIIIGPGPDYWRKEGNFDVYTPMEIQRFKKLDEALQYQSCFPTDSATWDVTDGASLVFYQDNFPS